MFMPWYKITIAKSNGTTLSGIRYSNLTAMAVEKYYYFTVRESLNGMLANIQVKELFSGDRELIAYLQKELRKNNPRKADNVVYY